MELKKTIVFTSINKFTLCFKYRDVLFYSLFTLLVACTGEVSDIFKDSEFNSEQSNDKLYSSDGNIENPEHVQDDRNQSGRSIIKMKSENGVKYVNIKINGIQLKFIFDTGASDICISPAEVSVLYRQGTLKKEDILDVQYFQDATGEISAGTKINLREVQIGDRVLRNVSATVINNIDAPLLLGQSLLERFGSIEIQNENNIIILRD